MILSEHEKQRIKTEIADRLRAEPEVRKVVVFGSFLTSGEPRDLDVAVFQDSDETYLPLALKYRRLLRRVGGRMALDVFPLRAAAPGGRFVREEILRGEVVYER